MGGKDLIWVCWQEPAADCGKTSQIPYNWVCDVLIGDGRAPGSVLKCRWPKTKLKYTAKVIAPPQSPHEQSRLDILHLAESMTPNREDDDEDDNHSNNGDLMDGGREEEEGSGSRRSSRSEPGSMDSFPMAGRDGDADSTAESILNDFSEYQPQQPPPPQLLPNNNNPSRSLVPVVASATSNVDPDVFNDRFQNWFSRQLGDLRQDILDNFGRMQTTIVAMSTNIRHLKHRIDELELKLDQALPRRSEEIDGMESAARNERTTAAAANNNNRKRIWINSEPVSVSRFVADAAKRLDQGCRNQNRQAAATSTSFTSAITVSSPSDAPSRNARKSIVHRPAPILLPPMLLNQHAAPRGSFTVDRIVPIPRFTAAAAAPPHRSINPSSSKLIAASKPQTKRRKTIAPVVAEYKADTNDEIILLGGDADYEITRRLYVEALENMYEDSPVYFILSLVRRVLNDQDVSRLWFKIDKPTQAGIYALRPSFAEALKRQASMQYPDRALVEREFLSKLNQATYDAKHRVKHGKGSTSRPHSYFSLDQIGIPITAPLASDGIAEGHSKGEENGSTNPSSQDAVEEMEAHHHSDDGEVRIKEEEPE